MIDNCGLSDLTEDDVLEAMRSLNGYVDITPGMFREIYALAYDLVLRRVRQEGRAGDVMTTPVHCVRSGMSAAEVATFLAKKGVSGAPVLNREGLVCGVVSEKDFLRRMGLTGGASVMTVVASCLHTPGCMVTDLRDIRVDDIMSSPPLLGTRETSLADVSDLFSRHGINRLPICDTNGHPLGIVTRSDLVGVLCGRNV